MLVRCEVESAAVEPMLPVACDDCMGWLEARNGGADGGGWWPSELHLQRITHRHLMLRDLQYAAAGAIRAIQGHSHALELRVRASMLLF